MLLPLWSSERSDKIGSAPELSGELPAQSSRQRGIIHEITEFHPVVSHLAGTPPVDRVPVDSIYALAHALDGSPHALSRLPTWIWQELQLVYCVSQERRG